MRPVHEFVARLMVASNGSTATSATMLKYWVSSTTSNAIDPDAKKFTDMIAKCDRHTANGDPWFCSAMATESMPAFNV